MKTLARGPVGGIRSFERQVDGARLYCIEGSVRPEDSWEGNEILLISHLPHASHIDLSDLQERSAQARTYLMSWRAYAAPPSRLCAQGQF